MKLHFLGTAGYHPTERRHTACLMIPEAGIVLDAGTGIYRIRNLVCTPNLDIFLTHTHLDHVVGLTFLLDMLDEKVSKNVTVHAQPEKLKAIDEHLLNEHIFPIKLPYKMMPLETETAVGGGKVRYFPLRHPGGAIGFRLDWPGHSMAYASDTTTLGAKDSTVEHLRGVDLLVHECYYPDGMEAMADLTGHSCATPVAEVARAAGVKRLILIHVNPQSDADDPIGLPTIRKIFRNAELSHDGMVVDF